MKAELLVAATYGERLLSQWATNPAAGQLCKSLTLLLFLSTGKKWDLQNVFLIKVIS